MKKNWYADNESENGRYGVYEVGTDRTIAVVPSAELAAQIAKAHNESGGIPKPPPIAPGHIYNFETLKRAAADGNLILISCLNKQTLEQVVVIAAKEPDQEDEKNIRVTPLAKMFDGSPFDELIPPAPALDA